MSFGRLQWFDLARGEHVAQARAACRGRPGVYLLRRKGQSRISYIGSSDPGAIQRRKKPDPARLWKTINRHFQSCRSRGAYSFGSDNWCTSASARGDYELALLLTKTGAEARDVEASAIAHYEPVHNAEAAGAATSSSRDDDDGIPF